MTPPPGKSRPNQRDKPEHEKKGPENGSVKSAERVLALLELMAAHAGDLTAGQIARQTSIPRSSLHGLLRTMADQGWIEDDGTGRLSVGPRALLVGISYLDADRAVPHTIKVLDQARAELGFTMNYGRLVGSDIMYLATREAPRRERAGQRIGRSLPSFAPSVGKAVLAELTNAEVRQVYAASPPVKLTEKTVTDIDALLAELDETRRRGYAVEREQTVLGVVCVGVVLPYRIPATDAISCSVPIEEATDERIAELGSSLIERSRGLAATLKRLGIR